jgi:hypothetical protein
MNGTLKGVRRVIARTGRTPQKLPTCRGLRIECNVTVINTLRDGNARKRGCEIGNTIGHCPTTCCIAIIALSGALRTIARTVLAQIPVTY